MIKKHADTSCLFTPSGCGGQAVNKCTDFENRQKKGSIDLSGIIPLSSYSTCSVTRAAPMELVLGWVSAAPRHGPARREAALPSRADVLGLRHPENASCWQRNATVRVKVKLLAACIPPELSQSRAGKNPQQKTKPTNPPFLPFFMASPVPPAPGCGLQTAGTRQSRGERAATGRHRCWAAPDISACECPANWRGWSSDT